NVKSMEAFSLCERLLHHNEKLGLEDIFPLFVFFGVFIGFIVLPSDNLFALLALDIANNVLAGSHIAFHRLRLFDVHYSVEKKGLPMLTAEILFRVQYLITYDGDCGPGLTLLTMSS